MTKCIGEGENIIDYEELYNDLREEAKENIKRLTAFDLMATTASNIALENNVDLIVCLTETGKISRYIAKFKPL